jgi:hypothetical protein
MKKETKGAGKPAPKGDTTSTKRSNAKIARWQAAAERDGFETWSQALTAWSKGEACLTKHVPGGATRAAKKSSISGKRSAGTPRR